MENQVLRKLTIAPTKSCTGSVIFLHGSGGTGVTAKQMVKFCLGGDLQIPHMQIHYPTAPLRRYTLNGGHPQNVWFDRLALEESAVEDLESIDGMARILSNMIDEEVKGGIPINRIVVGGFSMGGAMALHLGLRFRRDLGGIFCLSSFLSKNSKVYEDLASYSGSIPPLFMAHGEDDDMVPLAWGMNTYTTLLKMSVPCKFHAYPTMQHEHCKEELSVLKEWISVRIPYHAIN